MTANLTTAEADALIALTRRTGREIILPPFRRLASADVEAKADPMDLVTFADRAAEEALTAGVRAILPGAAVIGEEAVAADLTVLDRLGATGDCVVIDPIDGTFNYVRGLAVFGTIIAVIREGQTIFGLLYDPVCDDWVMATRGGGAEFVTADGTRRRLSVRAGVTPAAAEGFLPLDQLRGAERSAMMEGFDPVRSARALRCSCHEHRMLAMGQADFLLAMTVNVWDHAAGVLAAQEAGGTVLVDGGGVYDPARSNSRMILAADPDLASAVAAMDGGQLGQAR